ncbi:MAG: hypothetical protein NVSMB65_05130 [Chloroflexota bacterium]
MIRRRAGCILLGTLLVTACVAPSHCGGVARAALLDAARLKPQHGAVARGRAPAIGVARLPAGAFYYVRAAPTPGARVVGRIGSGDHVAVLHGVEGSPVAGNPVWYAVRLPHGQQGYVTSSAFDLLHALAPPWVGVLTTNGEDGVTYVQSFRDAGMAAPYAGYALGTRMTVLGAVHGAALHAGDDVWYRVRTAAAGSTFVYSAYIKYLMPGSAVLPLPLLSAAAVLLQDLDGGWVLDSTAANSPRPPASLAKMMTALIAAERLPLARVVTVPPGAPSVAAAVGGTAMGLTPGERLSVHDLLYGMLLPSGNDAAFTLAQAVGGSQGGFARLMNARASALGMRQTHFEQAYGLDQQGQYSTAHDLALLASAVLRVPALAAIVRSRVYTIPATAVHAAYTLHATNQLLGTYPGVYGVKTGTTPAAGQCLVVALRTPHAHHILGVVLGSADRYGDMRLLLEYATALEG